MSVQTDAMRLYFEANGIKLKDVADAMGISPASISNLLAGRESLGKSRARRLSELYGFNYLYLLTGEGSLFGPEVVHQNVSVTGGNSGTISNSVSPCPDVAELLQRISSLQEEIEAKRQENAWLRSLVDRLAPESK